MDISCLEETSLLSAPSMGRMEHKQPGLSNGFKKVSDSQRKFTDREITEESEDGMELSDSEFEDLTFTPLPNKPTDTESEDEDDDHTQSSHHAAHEESTDKATGNIQPLWFLEEDNPLAGKEPEFTGNHHVNIHGDSPVDYFSQLFTNDLMTEIVEQTNLYACQKGKDNLALTVGELKIYLGVVLVMTYIKYPRIRHYWCTEHGLRMNLIADAMSLNRWEDIRRYLHFIDSSKIPPNNTDKAIRIRPVLQKFHETFHAAVSPEEFQSVDEIMIPFRGRSQLKQYLHKEPKKWGFKMWMRAGISGYVYCFDLYRGEDPAQKTSQLFSASENVVLRLCHDLAGQNIKVYADKVFTSIPLVRKLKEDDIYFVGRCRRNRILGVDKLKSEKVLQKMGRGGMSVATSSDGITVTRWVDNSLVHIVSSYAGKEPITICKRFSRKEKRYVQIPVPRSVAVYNKHMGGVDLMASLVARYRNDIRNNRWYMIIFYDMLNVLVCNAWILWRWEGKERLDFLQFKSSVATALIQGGAAEISRRKRGHPSTQSPPSLKKRATRFVPVERRFDGGRHFPVKIQASHPNCCRDGNCKRKTRYRCDRCDIPLCPGCMASFHTR